MEIQVLKKGSKKSFKRLVGINRDTTPAHVSKLKASISKIGMLQAIIVADLTFITGKKETYIIEGQHKYEACMALEIDIPYTVINTISNYEELVNTIALLNSSSKSWTLGDYVMAWSSINNDYKRLMFYYNKYGIEIVVAAGILSDVAINSNKASTDLIKSGKFKITNEEQGSQLISYLADAMKVLPKLQRDIQRTFYNEFIGTVKKAGKNYDHTIMMRYLNKQKDSIISKCVDTESVKQFFKDYLTFVTNQKGETVPVTL